MNDSNRPSSGQPPIYQGVRRMTENLHGRGIQEGFSLNNNRERNFQSGRPNLAAPGRGGEPPPPRGRGDRHVPMPGRGFYNVRDRFIEHDSFTGNRFPHRPNFGLGVNMVPPPPPPPMQGLLVRGIPPPPPPPRSNPGMWMPSPGMTAISMSPQINHSHFNHSSFNQFPQSNNSSAIYQNLIPHHQMAINPNSQSQLLASTHSNSYVIPESIQGVATQPIDKATFKLEIDKAWTEHIAPNSMKYFYNSITKESTYVKPEALIRSAVPSKPVEQSWVEYVDTQTGKTYYSNGVSTTWEKPESFKASARVTSENNDEDHPRKKKKAPNVKITEFTSKSEAIVGFKGLLLAKDVQPTTKWNDVVKICSSDPRWEACKILTQGERKQALAEYQTKRANDLRDQERGERMRAKEGFTKLLTDILSSIESFNPQTSRFLVMRDYLSKDDRFYAVEDEETRESLFLEFCEEVRKRDERKKRNKKREAKASLLSFLRDNEESGELTYASTWYVLPFSP
jgi:FF domain